MTKGFKTLVLSATLLWSIGLRAQAPTTVSLSGTISKYDASTRTLSLSTANGTVQLPVSPTARIRRGASRTEPAELEKLTGDRATVRYTESGDKKVVESIHVFEENQRRDR